MEQGGEGGEVRKQVSKQQLSQIKMMCDTFGIHSIYLPKPVTLQINIFTFKIRMSL